MAGYRKIYTSQTDYLYDLAKNEKYFSEEQYAKQIKNASGDDYLAFTATYKDNLPSSFDETEFDKLGDDDKFAYMLHKADTNTSSEAYKQNEAYFKQKFEEIKNNEIYNSLNDFERTLSTFGGWVGSLLVGAYGTIEGLLDLGGLLVGAKDFVAQDTTGYAAMQEALSDFRQAYTFENKQQWLGAVNDVFGAIGQMAPMLVTGGATGLAKAAGTGAYYLAMAGSTAESAVKQNSDINYGTLLGYTVLMTGLEAGTEWLSGKVFGEGLIGLKGLNTKAISSGMFKTLLHNMGTEAAEEAVSELFGGVLEYWLVTQDRESLPTIDKVLYASLIGGLTGGFMAGGRIALTPRMSVTSDGQVKYNKDLTPEERKNAKKLGLHKSWAIQSLSQQSAEALNTVDNMTKLQTKYGNLNLEQIKTQHAEEYYNALAKDEEIKKQQAKSFLSLAKLMHEIGEQNFKEAVDLLNMAAEDARVMADNYINHRAEGNKKASEVFAANFPNRSFTPTTIPSKTNQAFAEAIKQAFPNVKVVFGTFGDKNGEPVRAINGVETYIFIDENFVDSKGFEQALTEGVRYQLAEKLMEDLNIIENAVVDKVVKTFLNKDVKYSDLTREQKLTIAQMLCFDDKSTRKLFRYSNKTHQKIYKTFVKQAEDVKKLGRKSKANTIRYHELLVIRNMYIQNIIDTIGNMEDVATIIEEYNITEEEIKESIAGKMRPSNLNDKVRLTKIRQVAEVRQKYDAIHNYLMFELATLSDEFDFNRLYDPDYYLPFFVEARTRNGDDFETGLKKFLRDTYGVEFMDKAKFDFAMNNTLTAEMVDEFAKEFLTKEYLNTNPSFTEKKAAVIDALYTFSQTGSDTDGDSVIVTDNQIQGTGKLRNLSGELLITSPQTTENINDVYSLAQQNITNENRKDVLSARTHIVLYSHNPNAANELGVSQSTFNKQLLEWAEYPVDAAEYSQQVNKNVPLEHRWVGLENLSAVRPDDVSKYDMSALVKSIKGNPTNNEKAYIMSTMLAIDTNIDYRELSFEFKKRLLDEKMKVVYGEYDQEINTIYVGEQYTKYTVAHEMGHAIDWMWGKELTGTTTALTETTVDDLFIKSSDAKNWFMSFTAFVNNISEKASRQNNYEARPTEIFARFIESFCNWAENKARLVNEMFKTPDNFSETDYTEFVKLLQEKSKLDDSLKQTDTVSKKSKEDIQKRISEIRQQLIDSTYTKADTNVLEKELALLQKELALRNKITPKQQASNIIKSSKASSPKQIADAITSIVANSPIAYSESQGFDNTDAEYTKVAQSMIDENFSLFRKVNQENYKEIRQKIAESNQSYTDQALIIFDRALFTYADDGSRFDKATQEAIKNQARRTQTISAQWQGLQSRRLADKTSLTEVKNKFAEEGINVAVSDDMVARYVPEIKNKADAVKQIDNNIAKIEQQIENANDDIERAALNKELKDQTDKRIVFEKGTNEEILDWAITNEDIVSRAAKIQKDVFEQMVEKAELAAERGKKAVTILVDEKTGLPKPFPKTTQAIEKTVKKLKSFRMWAMLTSPVSWVRNWVGNAGMTALDSMTNSLEKFMTARLPKADVTKLEQQVKSLQNKKDLSPKEQAKLAELHAQIQQVYDFKFVETTASKELKQQIAKDYKDVLTQILNGEDVSKYEGSAEKAGAIARAEREITRKSQNATFAKKLWAACQSMTDWGLNTGLFGDNAVVLNSLVKNFANMVESNKPYLLKSLSVEYGKDGLGMSDDRKALVEKALNSKKAIDIVNAMSKADTELFLDSCKQRTFEQYFKNSNWISKWASNLSQKHPIAASLTSMVLPFPKVAANVMTMAYKYSPLGFISALRQWSVVKQMDAAGYEGVRDAFARAKLTRTTAQATVGTMMCIAGLILAALGVVDIDEDDYMGPSLNIGDIRISLSNLAPSMTTFSVGAGMLWAWKNDKSAMLQALDVLYDNTLLGNIENVFRYGSPDKYIENLSINYVSQYVPAVLKLFAKFTTNQATTDKSGSYFEKLGKTFASGIPFVANALPKKINPYTGEVLTGTGSQNVFFNFIEALSPLDFKSTSKPATQKEAERLGTESSGLSGTFNVNDVEYNVDKVTYGKYRANYIQNNFEKILSGKQKVTVEDENGKRITTTYDKLNDKQKKNVINRLYTDATSMTKIKWWTDQGNTYVVTDRDLYNEYRKMFSNIVYKKNWSKSKFVES